MIRYSTFLFLLVILLQAGCRSAAHLPHSIKKDFRNGNTAVGWNEDTVNSCSILLGKKKFYCTIIQKYSTPEKRFYYSGNYKRSSDTLFLQYDEEKKPLHFTDFLILESTNNYLIQNFTDHTKHMFLSIQGNNFRSRRLPWE